MSNGNKQSPTDEESPSASWDTLTELYQSCAAYIVGPGALSPYLRDRELCAKVKDQTKLVNNVQILSRDIKTYGERLMALYSRHKNKTGPVKDADDHMRLFQIFEEYVKWCSSYEAVVIPSVETVFAQLIEAGAPVTIDDRPPSPTSFLPT